MRIRLIGGLGNQMFQYATAYAVARELNYNLIVDTSSFKSYDVNPLRINRFTITSTISDESRMIDRVFAKGILKSNPIYKMLTKNLFYFEDGLEYSDKVYKVSETTSLFGYFQSERYFKQYRNEICQEFKLSKSLDTKNLTLSKTIQEQNSVSIHVRRGDYLTNKDALKVHGICSIDYYKDAYSYLLDNGYLSPKDPVYIYSNDVEWCQENMMFNDSTKIVTNNSPEVDMYLMSLSRNQIIANSTFSWWAAWLNVNKEKIIIAPQKWFVDSTLSSEHLVPKDWIRV